MLVSGDEYIYLVFTESRDPYWWMRYLKKGFRHCYMVQPHKGQWLKYEYGHGRLRIDLLPDFEYDPNHCIIVKMVKRDNNGIFFIKSCVGFAKMFLGIKGLALTPYQLYKQIRG